MFSPQRQNYDQIPYIAWKGQTFQQVTSTIQKNLPRSDNNMIMTRKMRNPLKIYRREIVTQPTGTTCNRSSVTIAEAMDRPNGAITLPVNNSTTSIQGALSTLDFNLTSNTTERPGTCSGFTSPAGMCQDPASNALRRVRSAGMIKRNTSDSVVPKYFTDKQQYLANRGLGYQQNEFHFLRTDVANNATVKPGSTTDSVNNTFYGNVSLNYCPGTSNKYIPSYYKPNNPGFAQQGGVSASARSANLKYNTIVTAAATTSTPFGPSTASALSYGTASNSPNGVTYSLKAKMGYPNKKTPKFPPAGLTADTQTCCFVSPLARPK